jgi:hypothetical protein
MISLYLADIPSSYGSCVEWKYPCFYIKLFSPPRYLTLSALPNPCRLQRFHKFILTQEFQYYIRELLITGVNWIAEPQDSFTHIITFIFICPMCVRNTTQFVILHRLGMLKYESSCNKDEDCFVFWSTPSMHLWLSCQLQIFLHWHTHTYIHTHTHTHTHTHIFIESVKKNQLLFTHGFPIPVFPFRSQSHKRVVCCIISCSDLY